jgi:26S proteasome regulatory subunit T1
MTQDAMTAFLDGAIKNRIAVRLLAEQHIAVSRDFEDSTRQHEDLFGVVHAKCSPAEMIRLTGSFVNELCEATLGKYPPIEINGHVDATFSYALMSCTTRAHADLFLIATYLFTCSTS